jgi:elongation factor P
MNPKHLPIFSQYPVINRNVYSLFQRPSNLFHHPLAVIDKREMQYLYREGSGLVFMDNETYDQLNVETTDLGSAVEYLKEGDTAILHMYEGRVVAAELPAAVELVVTETEPGVQGDRVSGARKPATLETGLIVQVPLFVEPGEKIKVDTRSGEYLARA